MMRFPLSAFVAIFVGLTILSGYFFPFQIVQDLRSILLGWAMTLAGVAVLVGIINLLVVHVMKLIGQRNERDLKSILLITSFLVTFIFGMKLTPSSPQFQKIATHIQAPVETSLMALLSISLAYACLKLLQKRRNLMSFVFVLGIIIFLVIGSGLITYINDVPIVENLISMIQLIPLAGGRGIILGIALGSIIAGLRVLLGNSRPYNG